jgi:signal peptidase
MAKSLYEIDREFLTAARPPSGGAERSPAAPEKPEGTRVPQKKRRGIVRRAADLLFYAAIMVILLAALTGRGRNGAPKMFFGYSYFTVLTSSMQSELPRGSLVLVRRTDGGEIEVGDDITYMMDATSTVTHRVIEIYEDYNNSGERGFVTQGVNNASPDSNVVYAPNVVGVVLFHVPVMGAMLAYLGENVPIVLLLFGLLMALSFALSKLFGKAPPDGGEDKIYNERTGKNVQAQRTD